MNSSIYIICKCYNRFALNTHSFLFSGFSLTLNNIVCLFVHSLVYVRLISLISSSWGTVWEGWGAGEFVSFGFMFFFEVCVLKE